MLHFVCYHFAYMHKYEDCYIIMLKCDAIVLLFSIKNVTFFPKIQNASKCVKKYVNQTCLLPLSVENVLSTKKIK